MHRTLRNPYRFARIALTATVLLALAPQPAALGDWRSDIRTRLEEAFAVHELLSDEQAGQFADALLEAIEAAATPEARHGLMSDLLDVASLSRPQADQRMREAFLHRAAAGLAENDDPSATYDFLLGQIVRPRAWMAPERRAEWSADFRRWTQDRLAGSPTADAQAVLQRLRIEQGMAITRDTALGALSDDERAALLESISAFRLAHGPEAGAMAGYSQEIRTLSVGCVLDADGQTLAGEPLRLADLRGRVVLLSGWATWCAPCIAIFPQEIELLDDLPADRFVLLGVNDDEDRQRAASFADRQALNFASLWSRASDPTLVQQFAMEGLPAFLVLDAEGRIIARARGGDEWTVRYIHDAVREAAANLR